MAQNPFAGIRNPSIRDLDAGLRMTPEEIERDRLARTMGWNPDTRNWMRPRTPVQPRQGPRSAQTNLVRANLGVDPTISPRGEPLNLRQQFRTAIQPSVSPLPEGVARAALGRTPPQPITNQPFQFSRLPGGGVIAQQALGARPPAPPSVQFGMPTAATRPMSTPFGTTMTGGPRSPLGFGGGPAGAHIDMNTRLPWTGAVGRPAASAGGGGLFNRAAMTGLYGKGAPLGRPLPNMVMGSVISLLPGAIEQKYNVDFDTPEGRFYRQTLEGAGLGTSIAGPKGGLIGGVAGGTHAATVGRAEPLFREAAIGEGMSEEEYEDRMESPLSKVMGWFGLGDGGDDEAAAQQQQQQQAAAGPPRVYDQNSLVELMDRTGVDPRYRPQLLQEYSLNLELAKAMNAPVFVNQVVKQSEAQGEGDERPRIGSIVGGKMVVDDEDYARIEEAGDKGYMLTDEELAFQAWNDTASMIPAIIQQQRAEQQANQDFLANQAALQAIIAPFVGQYAGLGQDTAALAQQSLGAAIPHLPGNMQGPAQNLANVTAAGYGNMGDATTASLALLPGVLAMERMSQQQGSGSDYQNIYENQLNQALAAYNLQQQYPELFADEQSTGGGIEELLVP